MPENERNIVADRVCNNPHAVGVEENAKNNLVEEEDNEELLRTEILDDTKDSKWRCLLIFCFNV